MRDPAPELAVLHRALRPGGRLHLLYGRGPTGPARITATLAARLAGHGFLDVVVRDGADGCSVSARVPPVGWCCAVP